MTPPLRSRRDPCALHGLAVADDGRCVRCRRDDGDAESSGIGWPALFAFGCCAAGLLGWQAAKMGPEALSLRPQHHLAVVSLEASSPVERLRREHQEGPRARRIVRPAPVAAAHAPHAVQITVTEAEQRAFLAPPAAPVPYYGSYDPEQPPAPTTIVVKIAPPEPAADVPVFRGVGPADTLGGGGGRHRRAIPNRPVLLPPPGGSLPGGGTGELWNPRGPSAGTGSAHRTPSRPSSSRASSPRSNRPSARRMSASRPPAMRGGAAAGARPPVARSHGRR